MKKHVGFIVFFAAILAVFFWDVLFLRSAFLEGDYADQFYPWSRIYAESIKAWSLPFWTQFFHSGFPLAAEGQTGVFYPLNMIFFMLFSFKAAYNYIVVFHFALAGIFTYMLTRKLGADVWGGALGALLFCFGSAYAGCFYNTVTVKTLIWVPLVFYLIETYFERKRLRYLLGMGVVAGFQFLAGFAQMALYSCLFYFIYFMSGLLYRRDIKAKDFINFALGSAVGAVIFLPQLLVSLSLVSASMRGEASLGFALWGSFSPMNFMSMVFPSWIFQGTRFYIGIFSLLFLIAGSIVAWRDKPKRPIIFVLLISVFIALGKYNPLYVLVLKLTGIYSFRNPSKFLFFGMFASAVLSGMGFSRFFAIDGDELRKSAAKLFSWIISVVVGLFLLAKIILVFFGQQLISAGEWYAKNHIYGKSFHRYSLETYMTKVRSFYDTTLARASFESPYVIAAFALCVLALMLCWYFSKRRTMAPLTRVFVFLIIIVDIYIFSFYGTGFRGNIRTYDYLKPRNAKIYEIIKSDKERFRILPFDMASGKLPNWAKPNLNAVYGIESVAAYSPLVSKDYYKALEGLECVDNSLGLLSPSQEILDHKKELLRAMNVKYIVSPYRLDEVFIQEKGVDGGVYLYELAGYMPRAFLVGRGAARLSAYSPGYAEIDVNAEEDATIVLSEYFYEGWVALVDGQQQEIEPYRDILMSVKVPKGQHKIVFRFYPFGRK